jgi:hypothetical protein
LSKSVRSYIAGEGYKPAGTVPSCGVWILKIMVSNSPTLMTGG